MRLHRLELVNFRGFESLALAFDEKLAVLVGENGAGKSSVLDALLGAEFTGSLRSGATVGRVWTRYSKSPRHMAEFEQKVIDGASHATGRALAQSDHLIAFGSTRSADALRASRRAPEPDPGTPTAFPQPRPEFGAFMTWFYENENYENQQRQ